MKHPKFTQGMPENGISAGVVELKKSIDELKAPGEKQVKGKMVFFSRAVNPTFISSGNAYGDAARQRVYFFAGVSAG